MHLNKDISLNSSFVENQKQEIVKNKLCYDVNFLEYTPKINKSFLPSSYLLDVSFSFGLNKKPFIKFTNYLQEKLNPNETVWGCKLNEKNELIWEYYFYYYHINSKHSYENIIEILTRENLIKKSFANHKMQSDYYILSFELTEKIENINIYYPEDHLSIKSHDKVYFKDSKHYFNKKNPSGREYIIDEEGKLKKGNLYLTIYSFDNNELNDEVLKNKIRQLTNNEFQQIYNSPKIIEFMNLPFIDNKSQYKYPFAISQKNNGIGLYFFRATIDCLINFLKYFNFHSEIIDSINKNKNLLNYLYFDYSFTMNIDTKGDIVYSRPSFYGTF